MNADDDTKQLLDPVSGPATDYETVSGSREVTENGEEPGERKRMSPTLRLVKTCAMAAIYVGLGFNGGVQGPSLLDLSVIYTHGNVEKLSLAVSMKAVGILLGSFIGAIVGDRFRKFADLVLFLIVLMNGLCCAAIPWMPNVPLLGLVYFLTGVGHGTANVACCSISIAVWGERAAAPVHALHTCYTLGYTLAQPIVGLFVVSTQNSTTAADGLSSSMLYSAGGDAGQYMSELTDMANRTSNGTQIYIPFGVFGAYHILLSFVFLAFFLLGLAYVSATITTRKSFRDMLNPSSCSGGRGGFGLYMLVCLFFIYIGTVSREAVLGLYTCTIGTMVFDMSGFKASLLGLAYNLSILAGRVLGMFLAMCVRIQILVFVELTLVLVLTAVLAILGTQVEVGFWILICLVGFFIGPNYPAIMAWADRYIEATGSVVAVIDVGIGVGAFMSTYVGGILLENYGPNSLFYMCLAASAYIMVIIVPLQVVSRKQGDRHHQLQALYETDNDSGDEDMPGYIADDRDDGRSYIT